MLGEGCGGQGVPASGCCLASVMLVCQRLISFLTACPLDFVVGFYFLIYFHFLPPPPPKSSTHPVRHMRVHTHMAFPSTLQDPRDTPWLCMATTWGVVSCPAVRSCHAFLASDLSPPPSPPKLQAGVWAGRQMLVSGAQLVQIPPMPLLARPRQGRPDPAPPKPLLLQYVAPRVFSGWCCSAKVGAFKLLSQDRQPKTSLLKGMGLCQTQCDRDAAAAASPHPAEGLRILGLGKVYSGYFLALPGPMEWWPWPAERWGCSCPLGAQSELPALHWDCCLWALEGHGPLDGPHGFSFLHPTPPPPPACPSAPAVVVALPG